MGNPAYFPSSIKVRGITGVHVKMQSGGGAPYPGTTTLTPYLLSVMEETTEKVSSLCAMVTLLVL